MTLRFRSCQFSYAELAEVNRYQYNIDYSSIVFSHAFINVELLIEFESIELAI